MNQKGVFITFMVFLLVTSILALHDAGKKAGFEQEKKDIAGAAFNVVNNAFNNVYEEVVSLNKEGYAKEIQQRPMPFEYDFNNNSIIINQRVPANEFVLDAYVDALNIYSIFANESSSVDINIVTGTIRNPEWDTLPGDYNFPDMNYVISPQCLLYDVNYCCVDVNLMILKELQDGELGCEGGFNYANLKIVDINVSISSIGCSDAGSGFGGTLAALDPEPFDPESAYPYLKITINERNVNCPGSDPTECPVTKSVTGKKVITKHFNPDETVIDSLKITCDAKDWGRIKVGKEDADDPYPIVIKNWARTNPLYVDLNLTFDQKVDLFYFTGFSISVEKKNFPIRRSS